MERTPEGYRIIRINPKSRTTSAIDSLITKKKEAIYQAKPDIPFKFSLGASLKIGEQWITEQGSNKNLDKDESRDLFQGVSWQMGLMALLPLDKNTAALKLGILFNYASLSGTSFELNDGTYVYSGSDYIEKRIAIPALLVVKGSKQQFVIEVGLQLAIPISSLLKGKYAFPDIDQDFLENGSRKPVDVSILFGIGHLFKNKALLRQSVVGK